MRLTTFLLGIYWAFTPLNAIAQSSDLLRDSLYHQTIKDSWTDSVDIRQPNNSRFEIYNLTISRGRDITKIIIDSTLPINGVSETQAIDSNIGWGDLLISPTEDSYSEIGIVFSPVNPNPLGIYSEITKVSRVKENFGDKSHYGQITSIDRLGEPVGMVEVDYFEGLGVNNSNRTVITMPSSSIPFSKGSIQLAIECYNDFIHGRFELDIPEPPIKILPPEILIDEPDIPSTTPEQDMTTTSTETDDFNAVPIVVGVGVLAIIIWLFFGNSSDDDKTIEDGIDNNPTEQPQTNNPSEIPEGGVLTGLFFIVILLKLNLLNS